MTHVNWEGRKRHEAVDPSGVIKRLVDVAELLDQCSRIDWWVRWLVDDDRRLLTARSHADECRAFDARQFIEHCFAAFGVERGMGSFDAMRLSSAVPEAVLVIEITDVADAMPDGFAVGDFGVLIRSAIWLWGVRPCFGLVA